MSTCSGSVMATMSDPRAADEVLRNLTVARGHVQHAWNTIGELRGCARSAEQAVEDAHEQTARAQFAPSQEHRIAHLATADGQLDFVRQRCAVTAKLAGEIRDWLDLAGRHVDAARAGLDDYGRGEDTDGATAADLASLRAGVDNLAGLVELATPLAEAARTHMDAAAQAAAAHTTGKQMDNYWDGMVLRVEHGVQVAGRAVARGDEASRHLDRTVGHVDARAGHTVRDAGAVAAAAEERLRSTQYRTPWSGPSGPTASGPVR